MAANLLRDTAVIPVPGHSQRYRAELPDSWNWRLPSGGVLMTVGLRAIREAIGDPAFAPVSATTTFCRPVPQGIIDIDVETLHRGNAVTQVRASLRALNATGVCLEVAATFARERQGPGIDYLDAVFPDVPRPDDAKPMTEQIDGAVKPFPFLENIDMRLAQGHLWWESGWAAGPARMGRWVRYKTPQRMANGLLDPLVIPPIADMMPAAIRHKIGPEGPQYYAPSLDLTVHFLDPTASEWLLLMNYARWARAGYATAETEVWSEDKKLVAYATQTMILRTPGG
jgi:acyl-CoA thioesterase